MEITARPWRCACILAMGIALCIQSNSAGAQEKKTKKERESAAIECNSLRQKAAKNDSPLTSDEQVKLIGCAIEGDPKRPPNYRVYVPRERADGRV